MTWNLVRARARLSLPSSVTCLPVSLTPIDTSAPPSVLETRSRLVAVITPTTYTDESCSSDHQATIMPVCGLWLSSKRRCVPSVCCRGQLSDQDASTARPWSGSFKSKARRQSWAAYEEEREEQKAKGTVRIAAAFRSLRWACPAMRMRDCSAGVWRRPLSSHASCFHALAVDCDRLSTFC